MLERFLFAGRLQRTQVGKLSGGEKRRLYLLQVLISNPKSSKAYQELEELKARPEIDLERRPELAELEG